MNSGGSLIQSSSVSFFPAALGIALGVFFGVLLVVGIFVIVVVANRADPDPTGRRPLAVYLFGVSFLSMFAALFGSFAIVLGLVQLIGSHPGVSEGGASHPVGDAVARVVVLSVLVFVAAVALLATHLRPGLALPEWTDRSQVGPVTRVVQSYLAGVCFVSVLIGAGSVVYVLWEVFRILGPGVFELSGTRVEAARALIAALYLALAAGALAAVHRGMLPPGSFGARKETPPTVGPPPSAASSPPLPPSPPPPPTSSL